MSNAGLHHATAFGEEASHLAEETARVFPPPPTPSEEPVTVRVLAGEGLADETWPVDRVRAEAQAVIEGTWTAYYSAEAFAHVYMQPEPPAVALALATDAERDRRLSALVVSFEGRTFQARERDLAEMNRHATTAIGAIMAGSEPGDLRWADPGADFGWIDAGNASVPMDATSLLGLQRVATAARSAVIRSARDLKDRAEAGGTFDPSDVTLWSSA